MTYVGFLAQYSFSGVYIFCSFVIVKQFDEETEQITIIKLYSISKFNRVQFPPMPMSGGLSIKLYKKDQFHVHVGKMGLNSCLFR